MLHNKIILLGKPEPLKRPRFTKSGSVYNSQRITMRGNSFVISSQYHDNFITNPVEVYITFFMPIPKSLSKKKKALLENKHHYYRPDIDNLIKKILDVITIAGIWKDDSLVTKLISAKLYSDKPRTEIIIKELEK